MLTPGNNLILIFCSLFCSTFSIGSPWDWQMTRQKSDFTEPLSSDQPTQLSSLTSLNSSAVEGDRASLVCQVKASHPEKGYTVSWLRANDTSVLSVGLLVFSSDRRFSVRKINKNVFDIWSLEIYPTWSKDEGWYQCQINTEPKTSHQCYLTVYNKAPTMARIASRGVEIKGDPYQTFTQGEEMRLECVLPKLGGDGMANSLKWTKTPEKNRGIKYEKKDSGAYFSLVLIAESVSSNDQGSYTCGSTQDSFLPPAQVFVRVREISIHDRLSQLEQRVAYLESQSLTYSVSGYRSSGNGQLESTSVFTWTFLLIFCANENLKHLYP